MKFPGKIGLLIMVIATVGTIATSALAAPIAKTAPKIDPKKAWCVRNNGVTNVVLTSVHTADCLTPNFAVRIENAPLWQSAINDANAYGKVAGKRGLLVLVLNKWQDTGDFNKAKAEIRKRNLNIKIEKLVLFEPTVGRAASKSAALD
jgi:hypothetical protein